MTPDTLVAEAYRLGTDMAGFSAPMAAFAGRLSADARWRGISHVTLVGHGDSYCAARSVELAFREFGGVPCAPMFAQHFLDYAADWIGPADVLVGVSASGATPRVIEALQRGRERSALTVAVTASPGSPLGRAADHALELVLLDKQPSPGVRSFHALLAGLLGLATLAGEARGHLSADAATALRASMAALAAPLEREVQSAVDAGRCLAALLAAAPVITFAGSGPAHGLALYGAAKVIEASAVPAKGEELEEWWHVPRFMAPAGLPLIIIAPPGRSLVRATTLTRQARDLGRLVVAITADHTVAAAAAYAARVAACVPEPLSPLLYHVFASQLAAQVAAHLGRVPFDQRLIRGP